MGVEDHGGGYGLDRDGALQGGDRLTVGVRNRGVVHREGALERLGGAGVVDAVDAQQVHAAVGVVRGEGHQVRGFLAARGARGVPGVQDHHVAAPVRDVWTGSPRDSAGHVLVLPSPDS